MTTIAHLVWSKVFLIQNKGYKMTLFTKHPNTVGETYLEHVLSALSFAIMMLLASVICTIHSVLPFLFEKTAGNIIEDLYQKMKVNRNVAKQSDC